MNKNNQNANKHKGTTTNAPKPAPTPATPVEAKEVNPAPSQSSGITSPSEPGRPDVNFQTQDQADKQFKDEAMASAKTAEGSSATTIPVTKPAEEDDDEPEAEEEPQPEDGGATRVEDDPLHHHPAEALVIWRWNGVRYPATNRQVEYMTNRKTPQKELRLFGTDPKEAITFDNQEEADGTVSTEKGKHRSTAHYKVSTVAELRKIVGYSVQD